MRVILSPQRNDLPTPTVTVSGSTITINGHAIDLSSLAPGDNLMASEMDDPYAVSARNVDGFLIVTLVSPVPADPTEEQRVEHVHDLTSGAVVFPASPEEPEEPEAPEDPEPDPEPTEDELLAAEREAMVVSRFQAKAALLMTGLLPAAELAVTSSGSAMIQLAWAEAIEWRRLSPTIAALQAALGLDDASVDNLFRAAALIEA